MTCSPIKLAGYWQRNESRYFYKYGKLAKKTHEQEYTYYTDDDVLEWEIPQYSLEYAPPETYAMRVD